MIDLKKPREALDLLTPVDDKSYEPLVEWVRGDIATKMGDIETARADYQKAKAGLADFPSAQMALAQLSAG